MTTRKYSSRAQQTTLSSSITSGDVTMTVGNGPNLMGGKTPAVGETYTVVIDPDTALEEIVDVSNYSGTGNTLTITRSIDTVSGAVAHSAGAVVRHMVIGRDLTEANTHAEGTLAAHAATTSAQLRGVISDETGTGSLVFATSPTLVTPALGTPASGTLTNTTGFPTANLAGLGTGVATFLATPSSANLATALTDETGSGAAVFGTSPTIATPTITSPTITGTGTIAATFTGNLTGNVTGNLTGTASAATLAAAATALATGRTISLTGDVTGTTGSFDGTGNATMTAAIGTGVIVNADISASAAISYSKLDLAGTITSADIANGTIVAADIADGTITAAKLTADPFARANHTGTQLAATVSDFDTQVRTSRLDQMAAPTASVALNAQKITGLADPTLAQDAATKAYTDTQITNLINAAPGALDTLDELAAALGDDASFSTTVTNSLAGKLPLAGGTMTGALVLSGAPTIGLHAVTKTYADAISSAVAADAATASAAATAAAASYDSFDDRYLGAKSSAPTLDNDGNSLVTGALYFNSVTAVMQVWSGSAWGNITSGVTALRWSKTAAGGETTLNGADDNSVSLAYTVGYEQVYLNGVFLSRGGDYTATTGSSITGLTALTASDIVEVIAFTPLAIANALVTTVIDAKGDLLVGTADNTVGRLAVGTNGQYLVADSAETTGLKFATLPVSTLDLTINAKTANYTLVAGDLNKFITVSDAGTLTITVPSGVFTAGQQVNIQRIGAGAVQIRNNGTSVLTSTGATSGAPDLRAQFSACTIICTSTNNFTVIGDIA